MIHVYSGTEELAQAVAERIVAAAKAAVIRRGVFSIALSGGSTPERAYAFLAAPPLAAAMPWSETEVFWGDERYLPLTDTASNEGMARAALFNHVRIRENQIHGMSCNPLPNETGDSGPETAAEKYETELKTFLAKYGLPLFDLLLLGLGEDGHTASLFPGSAALQSDRWVEAVPGPPPAETRITLTPIALAQADQTIFVVSGAKKADIVQKVLTTGNLPASRVALQAQHLEWMLDKPAHGHDS